MSERARRIIWTFLAVAAWLVVTAALLMGCQKAAPPEGEYMPLVSVAEGLASVEVLPAPDPDPSPDVPAPEDCTECNGKGYLGDDSTRVDCQVCDSDGDGDPTNDEVRQIRFEGPVRKTVWHKTPEDAVLASEESGRPILIVMVRGYDFDAYGNERARTNAVLDFIKRDDIRTELLKFECAWLDADKNPELKIRLDPRRYPWVAVYKLDDPYVPTASVSGDPEAFLSFLRKYQ